MLEIIKLIPEGGGIIALIVVVILFLRHTESISGKFTGQLEEMRRADRKQVSDLSKQLHESHKVYHDQVRSITQENVIAIRGLEGAVRDLRRDLSNHGLKEIVNTHGDVLVSVEES